MVSLFLQGLQEGLTQDCADLGFRTASGDLPGIRLGLTLLVSQQRQGLIPYRHVAFIDSAFGMERLIKLVEEMLR